MFRQDKSKKENNSLSPQDNLGKIILILAILMVISLYWRWALPGVISWGDSWCDSKSTLSSFIPGLWYNTAGFGEYMMRAVPIAPLVALHGLLSRIFHWDPSVVQRIVVYIPVVLYLIFSPWYLARTLGFGRKSLQSATL